MTLLSRDQLINLLREVGEILQERGQQGHLYVVGGAAMALAFDARRTTRDVDVAFKAGREPVEEAAELVAQRHSLNPKWLSSSASAFMSNEPDTDVFEMNFPGLRVTSASPEHLLAMKMRAFRDRDLDDLVRLFALAHISSPEQAIEVHNRFFSDADIGSMSDDEARYVADVVLSKMSSVPQRSETRQDRHWVTPHTRRGKPVSGHWRDNPSRS